MARLRETHIKHREPDLWNRCNQILKDFPKTIPLKRYRSKDKGSIYSYIEESEDFLSHERSDPYSNMATAIRLRLDEILKSKSIAAYIRREYRKPTPPHLKHLFQESFFPFYQVSLQKLAVPKLTNDRMAVDHYSRRRAINSLLSICADTDPKLIFNNDQFKERLRDQPYHHKSLFLKAVRIEPCLLQTKLGSSIIEWWPLWDRTSIRELGVALRPKAKARLETDFETSTHTVLLKKALLILLTLEPKGILKFKDRELVDLLDSKQHRFFPANYDLGSFVKVRRNIFTR